MPSLDNVTWLLRRLAVMPPAELADRLRTAARGRLHHAAYRATGRWPGLERAGARAYGFMESSEPRLFRLPLDPAALAADDVLSELIPVFDTRVRWRPDGAFWHTDPLTGAVWPHGPGQRPGHRPGNPVGDARRLWELNRLQHLVVMAAVAASRPEAATDLGAMFARHVTSWLAANPFPWGVNYASAMESALRVVAVMHAFDGLRKSIDATARHAVLDLLLAHGCHIEENLSLHSSAGNHTIAEAVGLLYLGLMLPEHPRATRWRRLARALLGNESARQVRSDGGPLEQATWYLVFVTDLLTLAGALLAHCGQPPIAELDAAAGRARDFLAALATTPATLPRIGDADDGHAIASALAGRWGPPQDGPRSRTFPATGIGATSLEGHDLMVFLAKDFGMPPNFGHGHSDLLSLNFAWHGEPILIETGTYLYGAAAERAWFRSAAGHNTVALPGVDQATPAGPFMWRDPPQCRWIRHEVTADSVTELACHDGYRRAGLTHWRGVLYRRGQCLAVWDHLAGAPGPVGATQHWHLGARPVATTPGAHPVIDGPGGRPVAVSTTGIPAPAPHLGSRRWPWSPGYGRIEDGNGLAFALPAGQDEILTVFWLVPPPAELPDFIAAWRDDARTMARAG